MLGYLFPGQGDHYVGMGKDLTEAFCAARQVYQEAEDHLMIPLRKLSFFGPERTLRDSTFAQPAIFVHSAAVLAVLHQVGLTPAFAAGHSLGEYAALYAAGAISFKTALWLVRERGCLMGNSGPCTVGKMAAVLGLDAEQVQEVCTKSTSRDNPVVLANHNAPQCVVVSGTQEAVERATTQCKQLGAQRIVWLQVSGAFHSPLMRPAAERWLDVLNAVEIRAPSIPVIGNVTAKPLVSAEEVRDELANQITSSVRWCESMHQILDWKPTALLQVGPGKTMKGLALRCLGHAGASRTVCSLHITSRVVDLRQTLSAITQPQRRVG